MSETKKRSGKVVHFEPSPSPLQTSQFPHHGPESFPSRPATAPVSPSHSHSHSHSRSSSLSSTTTISSTTSSIFSTPSSHPISHSRSSSLSSTTSSSPVLPPNPSKQTPAQSVTLRSAIRALSTPPPPPQISASTSTSTFSKRTSSLSSHPSPTTPPRSSSSLTASLISSSFFSPLTLSSHPLLAPKIKTLLRAKETTALALAAVELEIELGMLRGAIAEG
ncbi:hypothetical protein MMC24_002999 [Lignoscripta atroalba]|nr:hypothetical protein [Lignoscripta atroalba]